MFGYQNAIKTATLSWNSAVIGLDPSNLQNDDTGAASAAWQTTGTIAQLTIDTAASQTWNAICLARTNLSASALWLIAVYTDASHAHQVFIVGNGGGGVPNLPMNVVNGQAVYVLPAGIAGASMLISITDTTNPDGFINIPLAFAGATFQPQRAISWATTRGRDQRVDEIVTRSGIEIPQFRWSRRRWSIDAQSIDPTERSTFYTIDGQARTGGNILFIPDPAASTINADTCFGRLISKADFGYMVGGQRLTWKADATERL